MLNVLVKFNRTRSIRILCVCAKYSMHGVISHVGIDQLLCFKLCMTELQLNS